jgi:predicted ATPase
MKTTQYFKHVRKRSDRAKIKEEWIERAIKFPVKTETQSDGRVKKWAWIHEEAKFLRVILLEDAETVHNAFFDRSFKEKQA